MDLTATQSCDVVIYVENLYEENLNVNSSIDIAAISWKGWFQTWMKSLGKENKIGQDCEISLRLTSDRQIQSLNAKYRSIDKPTDVLAFATTESEIVIPPEMDEPLYLGDIIISLDTANRQAQMQNHSLVTELAWLSSHGLLHLLGWDHPDEASLEQMLQRQSQLIDLLKI
ncbi:MAG: rRNA maturation RNase YbeY [Cyanobacteria bacterium P01_G01_bin.19]